MHWRPFGIRQLLNSTTLACRRKFARSPAKCAKNTFRLFVAIVTIGYCAQVLHRRAVFPQLTLLQWITNSIDGPNISSMVFRPLGGGGVYTYYNVCIEDPKTTNQTTIEDRRIVVYTVRNFWNGMYAHEETQSVAGSVNTLLNQWTIDFRDGPIPNTHRLIDSVAYFVVPTCPGNFYHFWNDEFVRLSNVINRTGRLTPTAKNHILYRRRFHNLTAAEIPSCFSVKTYESILKTLYIDPRHEVYWMTKPNTCFGAGVFGATSAGYERDVIDHVRVTLLKDDSTTGNYVTIIQRRRRRFLNVDAMAVAAKIVSHGLVRVVELENLTVVEQVRVASTTCVMIGVHGAGLQWAMFMPPGRSSVIEVAWPGRYWAPWYSWLIQYGIKYTTLSVDNQDVHVNWTSYESEALNGETVNATEREEMLKTGPRGVADNVWKWADVTVDTTLLLQLLIDSRAGRACETKQKYN